MKTELEISRPEVEFTIEIEPEEMSIEGNASAIDDKEDAKTYRWIRRQLARGNEWAWCSVTVTATLGTLEGSDGLGGCSYRSESDFKQPGGSYEDMQRAALADLDESITAFLASLPTGTLAAEIAKRDEIILEIIENLESGLGD